MMKWYVVHTKPRDEDRAQRELAQQGFEVFLPKIRVEKRKRDRLIVVQEPLFPRYLFLHLDYKLDDTYTIRSTRGVAEGLLMFGGSPAVVANEIVNEISRFCEGTTEARPLYHPGDALLVKEGPFKGLSGILESIHQNASGEVRVLLLIELLGKTQRLPFAVNQIASL